jgi:ectoine hydroxylase-related dioxygenase (phytanoyl-CoA dioxygenase family)
VNLNEELSSQGFAITEGVLTESFVQKLTAAIEASLGASRGYALRHIAERIPEVARLVRSPAVRDLVHRVLGQNAFLVQSLFFDKTPEANWNVAWHQDLMVPVEAKVEDPEYGPSSLKDGLWHVQPPAAVLEEILTVRLHLDPCSEDNGPLRVLPGSHSAGVLTAERIDNCRTRISATTCVVGRGGALLMRPLLVHASSRAKSPEHRRVIQLEFAAKPLPGHAKWLKSSVV